jgi:protein-L-isoaspartate(D-aspartate) O-methyltransferase
MEFGGFFLRSPDKQADPDQGEQTARLRSFGSMAAPKAKPSHHADRHARDRAFMVARHLEARGIDDVLVLQAMGTVPREEFVSEPLKEFAYEDSALPIEAGQTISQPYIVALSADLLNARPTDVVLEVGTGSGYQAAVLAEMVKQVYSIELIESLGKSAAAKLAELGYRNVEVRIGDGYAGWPEKAPFDGIVVTAAAPRVPAALLAQLKTGGRMVIPVGGEGQVQYLKVLVKRADGGYEETRVLPVRFVPLVPGK